MDFLILMLVFLVIICALGYVSYRIQLRKDPHAFDEPEPEPEPEVEVVRDVAAIAIETTGLEPFEDEILELAIVDADGRRIYASFLRPVAHDSWPEARCINHIGPADVQWSPTLESEAPAIRRAIAETELLVAYNADWTASFLAANGLGYVFPASVADVYAEDGERVPMAKALRAAGIATEQTHEAVNDATLVMALWRLADDEDVSDLVELRG